MYYNDILYVSIKSIDSLSEDKEFLYKIFRPAKDFLIVEITEQTILKEDDIIGEWCKDNFVLLEKQKFELLDDFRTKLQQLNPAQILVVRKFLSD